MGTPIYNDMLAAANRTRGLDYSAGRIDGPAILDAGFQFVLRYIDAPGSTNPKIITLEEYNDLVYAGVGVLLVFEHDTTDALGGFDQGVAYARRAKAGADALGYVGTIFFCCDMHLSHSQIPDALAYLDGAASVIGRERVGAYGFWEFIDSAIAAGNAAAYWQCGIAPDSSDPVHIWQRNDGATTVAGVACDINELLMPLPEGVEELTQEEHDALMMIRDFLVQQVPTWPGGSEYPEGSGQQEMLNTREYLQRSNVETRQAWDAIKDLGTQFVALTAAFAQLRGEVTASTAANPPSNPQAGGTT